MSDLSPYHPVPPDDWRVKRNMADATLRQVEKDFSLHGIQLLLNINDFDYPRIVRELALKLEEIHFFERSEMPSILYQIDLNESKLVSEIQSLNPEETYFFIADKILKRCFEKVFWRYKMSNKKK